jgi:YD repeat-containing protein
MTSATPPTWTTGTTSNDDVTSVDDGADRLISRSEPGAGPDRPETTTTVEHNAIGWTTAVVSPRGNLAGADPDEFRTTFAHDDFGRPVMVHSPLWDPSVPEAHQRSSDYDPDGNVVATVDGEANATTFDYDPAGQLLAEHRADATTLSYGYWPDESLARRTDGVGASTSYAYDAQGRPTTTTDPLGRASTTTYDAVGNPVTTEDPGGDCGATPKQGCTSYTYDQANQLVAIDYADPATPDVTDIDYDAAAPPGQGRAGCASRRCGGSRCMRLQRARDACRVASGW